MSDEDYAVAELERAEAFFRGEADAERDGDGDVMALTKRLLEVGDGAMEKAQKIALMWTGGSPPLASIWMGGLVQGALWERERAATAGGPPVGGEARLGASEARRGPEVSPEEAVEAFISAVIRSWPWTGLKDLEVDGRLERLKMGARIDSEPLPIGDGAGTNIYRDAPNGLRYALTGDDLAVLAEVVPAGELRDLLNRSTGVELRLAD